jgi:hypothetical protein
MSTFYKPPPEPWELMRTTAQALAGWFGCRILFTIEMPNGDVLTEEYDRRTKSMRII